MKKLTGVVVDKVAPNDPNVLWINTEGLYICEGGEWVEINKDFFDAISDDIEDIQDEINHEGTGILDRLEDAETAIGNLEEYFDITAEGNVLSRLAALEEIVFPEEEPTVEPLDEVDPTGK